MKKFIIIFGKAPVFSSTILLKYSLSELFFKSCVYGILFFANI